MVFLSACLEISIYLLSSENAGRSMKKIANKLLGRYVRIERVPELNLNEIKRKELQKNSIFIVIEKCNHSSCNMNFHLFLLNQLYFSNVMFIHRLKLLVNWNLSERHDRCVRDEPDLLDKKE